MQPDWGQPPSDKPLNLLLWTSRIYLRCVVNQKTPPVEHLKWAMALGDVDCAYNALTDYLNAMLVGSSETIQLHQPFCPCVSPHEQAFVTAVRSAQSGNLHGCAMSLNSVLQPATVRVCEPLIRRIAMAVAMAEANDGRASQRAANTQADHQGHGGHDRRLH